MKKKFTYILYKYTRNKYIISEEELGSREMSRTQIDEDRDSTVQTAGRNLPIKVLP